MSTTPAILPAGDRSVLVRLGQGIDPALNARVHAAAHALRRQQHPAVVEVTPGYDSFLVEYDPIRLRTDDLHRLIASACETPVQVGAGRTVEIPTCYYDEFAPDLTDVAHHTGLPPDEVIRRHHAPDYRVYCLGFSPGFPYLGDLDPTLETPRLASPRTRVSAGSVGIGGAQTGIYPGASPGGWRLVGRTPLALFDPSRAEPSRLHPGDTVRFVPIDRARFDALAAESVVQRPALPGYIPGAAGLRVARAGGMTTVQDLGRRGYQAYGVPVAGAADYWALMVGNWLLGNRARTAALELTLTGPELEFTGAAAFAITGAPIAAELIPAGGGSPRPVPGWRAELAGPGDRLRFGSTSSGVHSYLCLAGGLHLPPVLGSLSEDLFAGLGPVGRPLQAGDWLPLGRSILPPADLAGRALPADAIPDYPRELTVRVVPGPQVDAFTSAGVATLGGGAYQVGRQSDRQAVRLVGPAVQRREGPEPLSQPTPVGAIQVTGEGQPILLLANRQTMGGYPQIAVALYPDVARAAQIRPGDHLRFEVLDSAAALSVAWVQRRQLAQVRRYLQAAAALPAPAALPATAPVQASPLADPVAVAPLPSLAAEAAPAAGRHLVIRVAGRSYDVYVEEVGKR